MNKLVAKRACQCILLYMESKASISCETSSASFPRNHVPNSHEHTWGNNVPILAKYYIPKVIFNQY